MSGSKLGAAKAQRTIKERYGVTEDGKSAMHQKAGKEGAKRSTHQRAFAKNPKLASAAAKKSWETRRQRAKDAQK